MSHIDRELLRRYLSGDVSRDELARVEAWLAEDPDRWTELSELGDAAADAALGDAAVERAGADVWAQLRQEVGDDAELGKLGRIRRRGRAREFSLSASHRLTVVLQIAAAVVIAAGVGTAMAVWLRSRQPALQPAMRIASTTAGERATFRLSDGSRVMLGVASALRYPADFGTASREISLEGEAYFDVVHNANRPFVVHAGQLVAKDLGTQFTVRLYPEDASARVVVREGRVAIRAAAPGALERVVGAGQLGRLRGQGEPSIEAADTGRYFAWTEGRLVLDQVPLREALPQLGRWFDLEFRLADPRLGDIPLTVSLTSQPTAATLRTLATALGLEQVRRDRIVTFRASGKRP